MTRQKYKIIAQFFVHKFLSLAGYAEHVATTASSHSLLLAEGSILPSNTYSTMSYIRKYKDRQKFQ
jgi:hypothetical protein